MNIVQFDNSSIVLAKSVSPTDSLYLHSVNRRHYRRSQIRLSTEVQPNTLAQTSECMPYQSSQAKATPQAKEARRSSDPAIVVNPVTSSAKATYMAIIDSASMRSRCLQNLSNFRALSRPNPMSKDREVWISKSVKV